MVHGWAPVPCPRHGFVGSGGTPLPLASSLSYTAGQTRANNAIAPLNGLGELAVRCSQASGMAHFILDVNGYFE